METLVPYEVEKWLSLQSAKEDMEGGEVVGVVREDGAGREPGEIAAPAAELNLARAVSGSDIDVYGAVRSRLIVAAVDGNFGVGELSECVSAVRKISLHSIFSRSHIVISG